LGRKEFRVITTDIKDIPGDLIMKIQFTPLPLVPWDWVKGLIEKCLYAFWHATEIKWEGTTAILIYREAHKIEPDEKKAREVASDVAREVREAME